MFAPVGSAAIGRPPSEPAQGLDETSVVLGELLAVLGQGADLGTGQTELLSQVLDLLGQPLMLPLLLLRECVQGLDQMPFRPDYTTPSLSRDLHGWLPIPGPSGTRGTPPAEVRPPVRQG